MIPNSKEKQSFLQTSGQDAGTQCLSRTSGQDAPTADARRLSRLRRSLRKQTAIGLFCAPRRKSYESSYAIVTAQCFTGALPGRVV